MLTRTRACHRQHCYRRSAVIKFADSNDFDGARRPRAADANEEGGSPRARGDAVFVGFGESSWRQLL